MQTKVKKKQPAPAPLTQPMVQRQLAGAVDAVCVLRLEAEELSCKEHL